MCIRDRASVSYTVLVKSNQELHERIVEHDAQIADLEVAVESRDQQIDELSVSYTQIIPVLVKSNQELHERLVDVESAQVTLSTAALQEVDRTQQQLVDQIADLEAAVASRDQQMDELRSELSGIVSRLESLEA